MPARNAAPTLAHTVSAIPRDWVDEVILVDDKSTDNTVEVARGLPVHVIWHPHNVGYGGNQKTCYLEALQRGAEHTEQGPEGQDQAHDHADGEQAHVASPPAGDEAEDGKRERCPAERRRRFDDRQRRAALRRSDVQSSRARPTGLGRTNWLASVAYTDAEAAADAADVL